MPKAHHPAIELVLFDLDGTLADTGMDLAAALNHTRALEQLPPLPYASVRPQVSHGARALIKLGFGNGADNAEGSAAYTRRRRALLDYYRAHVDTHTTLFAGMDAVLTKLEQRNMRWGIVTDKPAFLTDPLAASLQLTGRAACIVSGDTLAQRKPHPDPLLHAALLANCAPLAAVYVGDALRDVQAAHAAGMHALAAVFGYLGAEDEVQTWGADALIHIPADILAYVDAHNAARGA